MTIKTGLVARLTANAGVAALVGTRVRVGRSPASDALPRINIFQIGADHAEHLLAASGKANGIFQLDLYAKTPGQAQQLADAVRTALHGFRGTADDVWISTLHLDDERDTFDEPTDGADAEGGIDGIQQDYTIGWSTSIPTF